MAKLAINLNEKFSDDEGFVGSVGSVQQSEAAEAKQLVSDSEVKPAPAEPVGSKVTVAKLGSHPVIPGAPVNDTWKKIQRAERFGVPVQLSEQEKRFSRAERFGMGSGMVKSEELKRKARAERFGLSVAPAPVDEEAKKKARLERFNVNAKNEEDKRKARAARFSNSPSSISQASTKAAVAGGASGGT